MVNRVVLVGRLTRDPELRYTSNNNPVASFTLAVNRAFSNQQGERETDFINIVVWGKPAENVKKYVFQGSQVAVDGRIQTRTYEAQDGSKRNVFEIVAESVQFLDSRSQAEGRQAASGNNNFNYGTQNRTNYNDANTFNQYNSYQENRQPQTTSLNNDPFGGYGSNISIADDDLPF